MQIVESHRREYYGISWWEDSDAPVLGHSGLKNEHLTDLAAYANSEKGCLSFGHKHSAKFLSNPHQILCAPNGWVITANTGRNCITIYDPKSTFCKELRVNDIRWDRLGKDDLSGEHFNSVYIKNDRLYALAHGFYKYSYVLEFSYPDCTFIAKHDIKQRSGLHNIWVDDAGNMISCHSEAGELIEIKSNQPLWRGGSTLYPKGLAATQDMIIVGDGDRAERHERTASQTGVWLIDRKSLGTIDFIALGPYGPVHEVRVLDIPDEAHHGKPFKNMAYFSQHNFLQKHREKKLAKYYEIKNNPLHNQFTYITGHFEMDQSGWMYPKPAQIESPLVIALAKKQPKRDFQLSIDYHFADPHDQHLSLIVGYRGSQDNNMSAIFLHHTINKTCHLYLMKNNDGIWGNPEVLYPNVEHKGKLSVDRSGSKLKITCGSLKPVYKELSIDELEGDVGIRCQGSQFKNFVVAE